MYESQETMGVAIFIYMWGPGLSALILQKRAPITQKVDLGLKPLKSKWWIWAWLIPLIGCIGAVFLSGTLSGQNLMSIPDAIHLENVTELEDEAPDIPPAFTYAVILLSVTIGAAFNGFFSISEELGWRGYLYAQTKHMNHWKSALLIGIVWGFWHAPIIFAGYNYPDRPVIGLLLMVGLTISMTPLINLVRAKSGTIWTACLFHGTFNAAVGVTVTVLPNAPVLWKGALGLGGILSFSILNIVLLKYIRPTHTIPRKKQWVK